MSFRSSKLKDREHFREIDNRWKRGYRERTGSNRYDKRKWSKEEIDRVMEHSISDRELGKEIRRSVISIQIKRSRANKKVGIDKNKEI